MDAMKHLFTGLAILAVIPSSFTGHYPPPARPPVVTLDFVYDPDSFPAGGDTIGFSPSRKLTWADFTGQAPVAAGAVANSAVGFKFAAGIAVRNNDQVHITLKASAYFVKSSSWVRSPGQSDYILQHEQLHFDIARLGLEKFRQLVTAKRLTLDNYNNAILNAYRKAWDEYLDMQDQYDTETNHSIKKPLQQQWGQQISRALQQVK